MIPVDSSLIKQIGYDGETLRVQFNDKKTGAGGKFYDYRDVPENIYDDLLSAESVGKFFHANIKGKYQTFAVEVERDQ